MKTVILAGGLGTRISEESHLKPKPMIGIGDRPILWHIMKIYSAAGFNDFIVCCGYKSYVIKEYFANHCLYNSDVTFDFQSGNRVDIHVNNSEPWRVTLVETGRDTMTGGRLKRVGGYVGGERFMLTYGDAVTDLDVNEVVKFHQGHGRLATLTSVFVGQRFGVLDIDPQGQILSMREKSQHDGNMINAGFMVLEPKVFDYIQGDDTTFEREPLERLSREGQLMSYRHAGFWHCMDTQRDKNELEELWASGQAPWKRWTD
jgi:glucose-1-phosphate cytidylyltransferase